MRGRLGLAPESLAHFGFAREMGVQHLDDERAAKLHMLGVIDRAAMPPEPRRCTMR